MQPHPPAPGSVLVVGGGYLGGRAADAWLAAGRTVFVLTRGRAAELSARGFIPIIGDVLDSATLAKLPAVETVLYAVGLDRSAGRSMRDVYVGGVGNVAANVPTPAKFIYISSTSVYAQAGGEWVDEDSETAPREESGRVVLDAERELRRHVAGAVILRFAGIYGPGRVLRRAALLAGEPFRGDPEKFLNLIHVEDGVRAVLAAETAAPPGGTFNVADGTPTTRRDFYTFSAAVLGAPAAAFAPGPPADEANRRVSNRRAKAELGFAPQYPSYREGLLSGCLVGIQ